MTIFIQTDKPIYKQSDISMLIFNIINIKNKLKFKFVLITYFSLFSSNPY